MSKVVRPDQFVTGSVDVTTSAIQIVAAGIKGGLVVKNVATETLYLQMESGTTANDAFPLDEGESLNFGDYRGEVWGFRSTGSGRAHFAYTE